MAVLLVSLLAAVVLPVVNRSADSGTKEARLTEFHDLETAVILMMTDNEIVSLPNPVIGNTPPYTVGTKILSAFPDTDSDDGQGPNKDGGKDVDTSGNAYTFTGPPNGRDKQGYVLYGHDAIAGDGQADLFHYLYPREAAYCYTVDRDGTVHQYLEDGTAQTS